MIIKYFGVIAETVGKEQEQLEENFSGKDISVLKQFLEDRYTWLIALSYQISLNRKLVTSGEIKEEDEIGLLPPFSGG